MDQLVQFVDWKVMLVQVINFAIIFYVLTRFIFKPLIAYLDAEEVKRAKIESLAADIEAQKLEADKKAQELVAEARQEAIAIKTQSETLAKKEASLMVSRANDEITAMKAKAELDLANERKQLEIAMKDRVLDVALSLNAKLFGKKEANADFIKQAMKK
ncbi:MAG: ATP synthase F0 subunit B [Candidatus Gracilibacteria bacterium]|nr:ATP synthase F0 subunit B [Candidatus Gracilibacteria bacterium]